MKICIFCSANSNINEEYIRRTEELGRWAASEGHVIVFGGNDSGLMHSVSRAAKDTGGRIIGVVPRLIEERGTMTPFLDEHIATQNLSDRKDRLMEQGDLFVVLPGGIGTLDELFCVATARGLGYHAKPIVLYNIGGCWNALLALLDDLQRQGMMRGSWRRLIAVADSLDDIAALAAGQQA